MKRWGLLLSCGLLGGCAPELPTPPNVVVITIESLRPDHVTCYGGARPTTPVLDALAAEGVVYTDAHSVTSWTLTSHASLFTGLYPSAHGAVTPLARLADSHATLAETLAEAGYDCGGVASGPYLRRIHGMDQGFEWYDDSLAAEAPRTAHGQVTNPGMVIKMREFVLERRDRDRPFFLFAYFWDPHYDYIPPPPYGATYVEPGFAPIDVRDYEGRDLVNAGISPAELAFVLAQYDGEVRWTDHVLGEFLRLLKAEGLWDDTLIVVTADHGEEFFEHGEKGHKHNLYRESVHVPLVVKYPGGEPRGRDQRLASLVDVLPTVLDVTGASHAEPLQGRSLLAAETGEARAIFQELDSIWYEFRPGEPPRESRRDRWVAVRRGDRKLIAVPAENRWELYDIRTDPREQHDLGAAERGCVSELRGEIEAYAEACAVLAAPHAGGAAAEVDEETLEGLRALGYVR